MKPRRPICAGCVHFRVTAGAFRYTCLQWGISSVRYNVAQLILEATGEPCPYCEAPRRRADGPDPPADAPKGAVDLRV